MVLVYNELEYTIKTFESLRKQSQQKYQFDIICVDNASDDKYANVLKRYCQENNIRYIRHEINDGYAGGNNYAYDIVKSEGYDIVFIANNDIELLHPDITESIIESFESNDKIALIGTSYIDKDGKGIKLSRLSSLIAKIDGIKIYENDVFKSQPFVIGCFFAIRTDIPEIKSLFDYSYFMYCEEQKLEFQLMRWGYHVGCLKNPEYVVKHYGGFFDWSKQSDWSIYLSTRNFVLTSKCYKHLYTKFVFCVCYFGVLIKQALINRKMSILRGYFVGLYMTMTGKNIDFIFNDAVVNVKKLGGKNRTC